MCQLVRSRSSGQGQLARVPINYSDRLVGLTLLVLAVTHSMVLDQGPTRDWFTPLHSGVPRLPVLPAWPWMRVGADGIRTCPFSRTSISSPA
jgi:hypothetical protein